MPIQIHPKTPLKVVGNVSTWEGLGQLLVVCVWEGSCFHSHGSSNGRSFDRSMTSFEPNISLHFCVYKCRNAAKNSNREMSACISCISACDLLRLISIHSMDFNRIHVWYIYIVYTCITGIVPYMYPMGFFSKVWRLFVCWTASGPLGVFSFKKSQPQRLTQKGWKPKDFTHLEACWNQVCFTSIYSSTFITKFDTVDGSEIPNNHLECIKPL